MTMKATAFLVIAFVPACASVWGFEDFKESASDSSVVVGKPPPVDDESPAPASPQATPTPEAPPDLPDASSSSSPTTEPEPEPVPDEPSEITCADTVCDFTCERGDSCKNVCLGNVCRFNCHTGSRCINVAGNDAMVTVNCGGAECQRVELP